MGFISLEKKYSDRTDILSRLESKEEKKGEESSKAWSHRD